VIGALSRLPPGCAGHVRNGIHPQGHGEPDSDQPRRQGVDGQGPPEATWAKQELPVRVSYRLHPATGGGESAPSSSFALQDIIGRAPIHPPLMKASISWAEKVMAKQARVVASRR